MASDPPNTEPVSGIITPGLEGEPLPRAEFDEHGPIADEPATDIKIVLKDTGMALRERMVETVASVDNVLTPTAAPTSRTIAISLALLDEHDKVVTDDDGAPRLSTAHELTLTNEALGRMGSAAAVVEAVLDARQIAAALAQQQFKGMSLFDEVLASRTRPPETTTEEH